MTRFPPARPARDLALVATMAGLMAALGLVPAIAPFGGSVPITAQSMGAMLAGALLGPRLGAASMALFLGLVALGLPLLSGGRGGLGVFAGPSIGYLVGFVAGAFVVGLLTHRFAVRPGGRYVLWVGICANVVGGAVLLYLLGVPGTAWRADLPLDTAAVAALAFVPGDILKAVVAALVARGVYAAYPGLGPARRPPLHADAGV
ncbi:biotin transporter BioY [Nocardioides massiliensis]|uniref:Biotin transporter n=1 Tax=Nocardioides massiliensis TaxID=1325935 RepID=A0ABT9NRP5_9ACTN|nr:biotin transporter BioY [Nocardioides massiliensis]MDP9823105.1 biotin transport system substrate-specific component [Nocardioides massiliensis]